MLAAPGRAGHPWTIPGLASKGVGKGDTDNGMVLLGLSKWGFSAQPPPPHNNKHANKGA